MTARQKLKAAVAKARHLENQKAQLETALETATTAVETATAELRTFDDLEAEVKKFRVDAVKGGRNGRDLPERLKQRLADRRSAEEELEQSTSTRDAISEELEDVRKRLLPLAETKRNCAFDVLREELTDPLAQELQALNVRCRDLAQVLEGFANISTMIDGRMQYLGHSPAMAAANAIHSYEFPGNVRPAEAMSERWMRRVNSLLNDADATLTIPKVITPADFAYKSIPWEGPGFRQATVSITLRPED